jgi:hypothetical protein
LRLKDLLGPVTRVKKKKMKTISELIFGFSATEEPERDINTSSAAS